MKSLRIAACAVVFSTGLTPWSANAADAPRTGSQAAPANTSSTTQQQYDAQMQRMTDMHQRMMKATTPSERQQLMNENMKLMMNSMTMMQGQGNWNSNMHDMHGGCMGMQGQDHHGMGMMGGTGAGMHGNCTDMMNMMIQLMQDQQNAAKTR